MGGGIWGLGEEIEFCRRGRGQGEEGEHKIYIFTIRRKYSKYPYYRVIILIVEKRHKVVLINKDLK